MKSFIILTPSTGNVYIADFNNYRIRKVTVSTGIITTIAGSSTSGSYSGDEGAATSAKLNYPLGVRIDSAGSCIYSLTGVYLTYFIHATTR